MPDTKWVLGTGQLLTLLLLSEVDLQDLRSLPHLSEEGNHTVLLFCMDLKTSALAEKIAS
jgi:hypothetical protein